MPGVPTHLEWYGVDRRAAGFGIVNQTALEMPTHLDQPCTGWRYRRARSLRAVSSVLVEQLDTRDRLSVGDRDLEGLAHVQRFIDQLDQVSTRR